jgi:hypothetical protein
VPIVGGFQLAKLPNEPITTPFNRVFQQFHGIVFVLVDNELDSVLGQLCVLDFAE